MVNEIVAQKREINGLCERFGVARLSVFGSAATGGQDADSDIDLLVEFLPHHRLGYADRYFGLLESLEAVLGRKVDLVVESAIRNPYFLESVEQSKVPLYAA